MYKREENGGYKILLFVSLLVILISMVLVNRGELNNYFLSDFYEKSFQREIPIMDVRSTCNEGASGEASTLFKILGSGLKRELNLLGASYVQALGGYNGSVITSASEEKKANEGINDFSFDYEVYEKRNIKVNRRYSDKNFVAGVYSPDLVFNYPQDKPQVLIYHTHTGEAYGEEKADERDNEKNVVAVGKVLAEELANYGIKVIHDTTIHDDKDYDSSYKESMKTIDRYLEKYGDMDLVIDIHRDAIYNKAAVTTKLNGKDVAKISFVFDKGNQNFKDNYKVASTLMNISNALFPGLVIGDGKHIYNSGKNHFNQHKSKSAVLIEVGAHTNKTQEAKETSKYLGRIIAEYLYKKYSQV